MNQHKKHSIGTRDIVTIAILSSLGGALSTFVGYLGNLINLSLGVPFGAGQFLAGLHVFWLVLIRVLVPRNGAGTAGGLLKGLVEIFTGSTHGIVIVIVSVVQGLIIDVGGLAGGNSERKGIVTKLSWWFFAGVSSASNVIVFQIFYFAGHALIFYISIISILAFCSGIIFAGYFAWETLEFINDTGILSNGFLSARPTPTISSRRSIALRNISALAFVLFLALGSTYYAIAVAQPFADPYSCEVIGLVENPYVFTPTLLTEHEVTIEAELQGAYTHIPPTNYTGILVHEILEIAIPLPEADNLRVKARDGYTIEFDLEAVMNDEQFLISVSDDGLWLVAANYDGSLWVKHVTTLEVY
jgi:energy-coupling factor transport system substrate-specific component